MCDYPLKPDDWPNADQAFWRRLTIPGGVLDEGGELSHLSQSSLHNIAVAYGRWLSWLAKNEREALDESPMARITAARVGGWMESLRHFAPYSRKLWIDGLIRMVTAATPTANIGFLRILQRNLLQLANEDHGSKKIGRIPSIFDVIDAGLDHAETGVDAAKSNFERARRLRDATMIVLLSMIPLRRKNFVGLELGRTIHVDHRQIIITLPAAEVKNRTRYEAEVQEPASALLRRYLEDARPFFAARTTSTSMFLWLADTGLPYSYSYFGRRIPLITTNLLGVNVPPHFFRDAVATSFARTSPDLARGTKAILGHTDYRTAERHYNHAQAIEAGRSYQEILEAFTKSQV